MLNLQKSLKIARPDGIEVTIRPRRRTLDNQTEIDAQLAELEKRWKANDIPEEEREPETEPISEVEYWHRLLELQIEDYDPETLKGLDTRELLLVIQSLKALLDEESGEAIDQQKKTT